MAEPVSIIPVTRSEREELIAKLNRAPVEHAAALLDLYELAQVMHERGTLDLLRGLVGAGDDIIGRISVGLSRPESVQALRDFVELTKLFAKLNPDVLCGVVKDGEAILADAARQEEPPGLWFVLRRMGSRDARRALGVVAEMLNCMGRSLAPKGRAGAGRG